MRTVLSQDELFSYCKTLADRILSSKRQYLGLFPIPMGGFPVGIILSKLLDLPIHFTLEENDLVIDDLVDSGKTLKNPKYQGHDKAVVFVKNQKFSDVTFYAAKMEGWIVFPHEKQNDMDDFVFRILENFSEDPSRVGLENVSTYFLNYLAHFLSLGQKKDYSSFANKNSFPFLFLDKYSFVPVWGELFEIKEKFQTSDSFLSFIKCVDESCKKLLSIEDFTCQMKLLLKEFSISDDIRFEFKTLKIHSKDNKVSLSKEDKILN